MIPYPRCRSLATSPSIWPALTLLLFLTGWATRAHGMTDDLIATLRQDTRDLFYHGWSNYLHYAFPEDELKPISCQPQVRNRANPADIGLNDVLGNYSLTLIDSLTTLCILASGEEDGRDGHHALQDFQWGVKALVDLYGDGSHTGERSCGSRACGFDLDSKVQVFETNIRGVGGLLSAHLFATGELPIRGYEPQWVDTGNGVSGIKWSNGFIYTSQLLDLAHDLATRLLPAFDTPTGLPYPRVNLRHGIPFYRNAEEGYCRLDGTSSDPREITETCAAGAGSLVLEFTVLSRLTGDERFETLAKNAFWAVWERRSSIGLVGGGLDAENGQWTAPPLAGIGAGIDSFYEYAFKSHILLSLDDDREADEFLSVWQNAHESIRRHVLRSGLAEKHPYYSQVDLLSGAVRYTWIDNLSAYYPGLLTLAGELDEAIEAHLVFAALWTRYSALPERWHAPAAFGLPANGFIDPNFKHWAGRPEFAESTYYLYQATRDPWYLHVGEMILRDIRRRCWARCGWADLSDVVNGEQRDRMESFFLGETAKYLFLLFEGARPGQRALLEGRGGESVVFTTEGHPLLIPSNFKRKTEPRKAGAPEQDVELLDPAPTCPVPLPPLPLTVSHVANRHNLFHAAALAQLHLVPINPARASALLDNSPKSPAISYADVRSPSNYTFYPWTLPKDLIPAKGLSSPISTPIISTLTFPNLSPLADGTDGASHPKTADQGQPQILAGALQKVLNGVIVTSLSNLRLNMIQIPRAPMALANRDSLAMNEGPKGPVQEYRIQSIANFALGQDEHVLLTGDAVKGVSPSDPHFTRVKDLEKVDLVLDVPTSLDSLHAAVEEGHVDIDEALELLFEDMEAMVQDMLPGAGIDMVSGNATMPPQPRKKSAQPVLTRQLLAAILPTGIGAAPLPTAMDNNDPLPLGLGNLPFQSVFFLDDTLCERTLPASIAKSHTVLVIKRGGCSFSDKLANIPSFTPEAGSLQLVIVVSYSTDTIPENLIRPLLDVVQRTPSSLERRHLLAMCMVDGSDETVQALRRLATGVGSFDASGRFMQKAGPGKLQRAGLAVRRRYWFESMGVPIANLYLV
ncbi:glycoside hydrolase [Neohortaea acidophila]|uniref:alpha-1,2-Mannosidase n=1 Tax=Neohortaea acidophila TaxID=245834 RepID=A0A6A6PPN3_9PEZI|nr:glycoside hydrolase [Neohortaea acidophila]KAF2481217.1 glycoside hydrolase [Neohortaea acidophila]